jgi:branched-chain amino acid transport system substrate-binding protein
VVKKLWPPLGTADNTPFIAQIGDVDGVVQGYASAAPVKFMKQYADLGIKKPVIGGETAADDALLKSFGDEAIGMINTCPYTEDLDNAANQRFTSAFIKDYGNIPGFYAAGLYINGQVVEAGLQKTGGNADDKDALIKAMRGVSIADTPRGPIGFDDHGNVIGNIYVRRIEKQNGKLVNKTIKTYEKVSQFWTYDEKWFLAQPVYSRDYPPLKS